MSKRDDDEVALPETEAVGGSNASATLVKRFTLTVSEGQDQGLSATSSGGKLVVGTDEACSLRLTDRTVSRFHCELWVEGEELRVRDLSSRNGTVVNEVGVLEGRLPQRCSLGLGRSRIGVEVSTERERVQLSGQDQLGRLVGRSTAMRAIFAMLERAAAGDATVLLIGETGTGKEAAAETLHALSARRDAPLSVVDCGAIPDALLESELFGHERGAFTGAMSQRKGAFELASGGTIFLDEIGELGQDLQPKLLRVLENRAVKRVGGSEYIPVDVRVIAATSRDLRAEVNAKRFRSDLYFRLAVIEARLPPLRERRDDLPLLIEHLLAEMGALDHPQAVELQTAASLDEMARHPWPGNVRELRNYVERALALGATSHVSVAPPALESEPDFSLPLPQAREKWNRAFEKRYLEHMLELHDDNVSAAARASGVGRIHFYRRLVICGLR